jgi:hypothetical protein
MRKTRLDLDTLAVDSFATTTAENDAPGTVRGHIVIDPQPTPPVYADNCTCAASCPCPTAAYHCATVRFTAISCTYTQNVSCLYAVDE